VILEVLYSSAIRREKTAHLRLEDVDAEHGFLIVREGKNRKDRAVPVGASVCALLQTYIVRVRKDWLGRGSRSTSVSQSLRPRRGAECQLARRT
jgi:site-specific recombinase XerD